MGDHLSSKVCAKATFVAAQLPSIKIHIAVMLRRQLIAAAPDTNPLLQRQNHGSVPVASAPESAVACWRSAERAPLPPPTRSPNTRSGRLTAAMLCRFGFGRRGVGRWPCPGFVVGYRDCRH